MTMNEMEKKRAEEASFSAAEMKKMIIDHLSDISSIAAIGITRDCSLTRDISLDSLDKVELMMWCEKIFDIAITPCEENDIETVGNLLDTVESKKKWRK